MNWQSPGGATIKVERKTGSGGTYSQVATVTNGANIYNDTGLSPSSQYYYRVRSNNFAGDSAYSNEISITTPATGATLPLTGLKMWLRGDFGVTADGNNRVSNWLDESGTGNSATQSSTGNQPITVGNAMYGKPALHFDGANSVLNVPVLSSKRDRGGSVHHFEDNVGAARWQPWPMELRFKFSQRLSASGRSNRR